MVSVHSDITDIIFVVGVSEKDIFLKDQRYFRQGNCILNIELGKY